MFGVSKIFFKEINTQEWCIKLIKMDSKILKNILNKLCSVLFFVSTKL